MPNPVPLARGGSPSANQNGQPLPPSLQHHFETSLAYDLSQVRVHTQHEQQATLGALGAQAFTQGTDIYFGAGKYQPFSSEGQTLLAHELAHVVQQSSGAVRDIPAGLAEASGDSSGGGGGE